MVIHKHRMVCMIIAESSRRRLASQELGSPLQEGERLCDELGSDYNKGDK